MLFGHSAGGAHVASTAAGHGGPLPSSVIGAIILSGIFDPVTAEKNPPLFAYYGTDEGEYAPRSAVEGLVTSPVPVLLGDRLVRPG